MTLAIQKCSLSSIPDPQLQSTFLSQIPKELVFDAILRVGQENFKDLAHIRMVCKRLYQVIEAPYLWEILYHRQFPSYPKPDPMGFHTAYSGIIKNQSNIVNGVYQCCTFATPESHYAVRALLVSEGKVITGSTDKIVRIYSLETGECVQVLRDHPRKVRAFALSNGKLVTFYGNQSVKTWDMTTGKCLVTLNGNDTISTKLIVSDGKFISGFRNGKIEIREVSTGNLLVILSGHETEICSLAVYDGKLFSGSVDGIVKVWKLGSESCLYTCQFPHWYGFVDNFAFSEGIFFTTFSSGPGICSWDIATGISLGVFEDHNSPIESIAVIGGKLISYSGFSSDESIFKVWEIATQKCLNTFTPHMSMINTITVFDEKLFLSTEDGIVMFLDFLAEDDSVLDEVNSLLKNSINREREVIDSSEGIDSDGLSMDLDDGVLDEAKDRFFRMPRKIRGQLLSLDQERIEDETVWANTLSLAIDNWLHFSSPTREDMQVNGMDPVNSALSLDQWMDGKGPIKKQRMDI